MSRHNVEVRTDGRRAEVLINGKDIADAVTGLAFTVDTGSVPTLHLTCASSTPPR